jgi:hypothetical protein
LQEFPQRAAAGTGPQVLDALIAEAALPADEDLGSSPIA